MWDGFANIILFPPPTDLSYNHKDIQVIAKNLLQVYQAYPDISNEEWARLVKENSIQIVDFLKKENLTAKCYAGNVLSEKMGHYIIELSIFF